MTPVLVLWAKSEPAAFTAPQITRTGLTYLAAIAAGAIAFSPLFQGTALDDAVVWVVILPLLWASLRQGPRDTATVTLIVSAFVVWCTEMQCGPFAKPSLNDSFILSLAFMISYSALSLVLSADVAMKEVLTRALNTELAVRHHIENQRRQRALETEVLWQATVQVASGGSFEDLLRSCLKGICRVTGWPVGHVYLPDNVSAPCRLLPSPVWYFEHEYLAPLAYETAEVVLAFGQGVPGKAWASGKSEYIRNISETANQPRKPILLKYGLNSACGFPLHAKGKLQAVLEFFSTTSEPPDEHLLQVVQGIAEQLGRVVERQRAQEQQGALEATLNALSSAVYLTDRHGRIIHMNRAAERQVSASNAIRVENNHLVPVDRRARLTLAKAIDQATADEADLPTSAFTLALPEQDKPGLIAAILPLAHSDRQSLCGTSTAAIFVQDTTVMGRSIGEAFAKLHGLTASELRVLLALAPGLSIKKVAAMLGVCETTARTHLQHIYSKTGTSKQSELIHMFMSSTPPVETP